MSDEIKLHRDALRASKAKQLMETELVKEAFKTLEDSYIAAWRYTNANDTAAREKLFLAVNVVGKVQEHLNSVIANGNLAKAELEKLAADVDRKKRFGII
jgi:hypothetical protein